MRAAARLGRASNTWWRCRARPAARRPPPLQRGALDLVFEQEGAARQQRQAANDGQRRDELGAAAAPLLRLLQLLRRRRRPLLPRVVRVVAACVAWGGRRGVGGLRRVQGRARSSGGGGRAAAAPRAAPHPVSPHRAGGDPHPRRPGGGATGPGTHLAARTAAPPCSLGELPLAQARPGRRRCGSSWREGAGRAGPGGAARGPAPPARLAAALQHADAMCERWGTGGGARAAIGSPASAPEVGGAASGAEDKAAASAGTERPSRLEPSFRPAPPPLPLCESAGACITGV